MAFLNATRRLSLRTRLFQSSTLNTQLFSTATSWRRKDAQEDFFGFDFDEMKEKPSTIDKTTRTVMGENDTPNTEMTLDTSTYDIGDNEAKMSRTEAVMPDTDRVMVMNFGTVRLDSVADRDEIDDLKPIQSSQSDRTTARSDISTNVDEQYFGNFARAAVDMFSHNRPTYDKPPYYIKNENKTEGRTDETMNYFDEMLVEKSSFETHHLDNDDPIECGSITSTKSSSEGDFEDLNYFDEMLVSHREPETESNFKTEKDKSSDLNDSNTFDESMTKDERRTLNSTMNPPSPSTSNMDDLNYFDSLLLSPQRQRTRIDQNSTSKTSPSLENMNESVNSTFDHRRAESPHEDSFTPSESTKMKENAFRTESKKSDNIDSLKESDSRFVNKENKQQKQKLPQTAAELVDQIRGENQPKVDSRGFIVPEQVKDLSHELSGDVVTMLQRCVVYNDNDILALNKPYGLATQNSKDTRHSTDSLLPQLAKSLRLNSQLYQVHRLDKNTTGVLLLAKTPEMQSKLIDLFRRHEITKKYWVLTKGVPSPPKGLIDVPMVEGRVEGRYRMTAAPEDPLLGRRASDKSIRAVTKYRVLYDNKSTALVECETVTGIKHQIRCHLGFVMNCPILGDHKYSHWTKLAPQKLFPEILNHLGIRQAKVRHLPIHLHASSIHIPDVLDGRGLYIKARLPEHFVENMKKLKLKVPKRY